MTENTPRPAASANRLGDLSRPGRRVLAAMVAGEAGDRIQRWRESHDPRQAARLRPHMTLCYWAPLVEPAALEVQVRHAFRRPLTVQLGGVLQFQNPEATRYVEVLNTEELDVVRARLYDGTYVPFPEVTRWRWHVTCLRYGDRAQPTALNAADGLRIDAAWTVEDIAYLELGPGGWVQLAEWRIGDPPREEQ